MVVSAWASCIGPAVAVSDLLWLYRPGLAVLDLLYRPGLAVLDMLWLYQPGLAVSAWASCIGPAVELD